MTEYAVTGTVSVPAPVVSAPAPFVLTPEVILQLMQRQLEHMDGQIGNSIKMIEDKRVSADNIGRKIQKLRELETLLREHPHLTDGDTINVDRLNDDQCNDLRARLAADFGLSADFGRPDIDDDGLGDHVDAEETRAEFNRFMKALGVDLGTAEEMGDHVSLTAITDEIESLTEEQRLCNSGSELMMAQLQSVMQQRSQIIQLGSNMLQKGDEAIGTIIGNMGR